MRLLGTALVTLLLLLPPSGAQAIEEYASYQPPERCHEDPLPGTKALARWVSRHYDGYVGTTRDCGKRKRVTSDHQAGRAVDWSAHVRDRRDRRQVRDLLRTLFAADGRGNPDAKARRMGIAYLIWNDEIYEAWRGFEPSPYLSSACQRRKRCSATLRHRDHVHISLSRDGARGETSWYDGRLAGR